ncbi:uncharacterized protein DEA37_0009451 [Paragonimus westermani]|uniref:EF-hand domain-containing protein n=1 Tax=Paragonimus westermani TaxID=34504 RepID=A0A5J4NPG6_9TREM|nr:uncharacterized protein DEA37_0009451 [Paragonimus westermani]
MATRRLSMTPGEALRTEGPEGRREEALQADNYLQQFFDPQTRRFHSVTASQFTDVWNHFDKDGNGFIDGDELQMFLCKLVECIVPSEVSKSFSYDDMEELVNELMAAIDTNKDNRIDLREMAQLLPTDEEFILLFQRDTKLSSSVDFMKVWKEFDKDHSGYIEADELKDFLTLLIGQSTTADEDFEETIMEYTDSIITKIGKETPHTPGTTLRLLIKMDGYRDNQKHKPTDIFLLVKTSSLLIVRAFLFSTITRNLQNQLKLFDHNCDGKLQLSEMARLLPVEENFLCRPIFRRAGRITAKDVDEVFALYDTDNNGAIEDDELSGFFKDLLELVYEDYNEDDLDYTKSVILQSWDINRDGKINLEEMRMLLLAYSSNSNQYPTRAECLRDASFKSRVHTNRTKRPSACKQQKSK